MSIIPDFISGANEVGASSTLVEIEGKRILVDAGIRMGHERLPDFPDFNEIGLPDAVLITHAHTDHIGALPVLRDLWQEGIKVYYTSATRVITFAMLKQSLNLMKKEEQEKGIRPIYTKDDLEVFKYCNHEEVTWFKPIEICNGVKATWIPAGHILGAAMIYIESKDESILMSGDVSLTNQLTIQGMKIPRWLKPDVMVMESTYGNPKSQHKDRKQQEKKLLRDVTKTIESGGKVLIPAFAIGRSQEVILILKNAMEQKQIPELPVYVDGMINRINEIYSRFPHELTPSLRRKAERGEDLFGSDMIQRVTSERQRERIIDGGPCYIISSSGMLVGGKSLDYAKQIAKDPKNLIAITGYQAKGTNGRKLWKWVEAGRPSDQEWELSDGKKLSVKCDVKKYSLSAHANLEQLMTLVKKVDPPRLYLVHGDTEARKGLSESIHEELPEIDVVLPENGKRYKVDKREGIANGRRLSHDKILYELSAFLRKLELTGPFHVRDLAEHWFGSDEITSLKVKFLRWCLSLDPRFFVRKSTHLYYLR